MSKPREFKFKVYDEPEGFSVIWDTPNFESGFVAGTYHVIEYSAYEEHMAVYEALLDEQKKSEQLQTQCDKLAAALEFIAQTPEPEISSNPSVGMQSASQLSIRIFISQKALAEYEASKEKK